jgi:hypothetical protein
MVDIGLLIIVVGIIYGYSNPGKEDKMNILKKGLKYGLILGVITAIFGLLTGGVLVAFAAGFVGIIGFVVVAFVISVEFIIGTFIGDYLEEKLKK